MTRIFNITVGRDRSTPFAKLASLLVAAAVFVFAFASPSRAEPEVRFGAALSLTGSKATEGRLVKDGYDFYVKHINERGGIKIDGVKHKVSITYYDDESDPKAAVRLTEKLIVEDGIKFLLGPYSSGATFPARQTRIRRRACCRRRSRRSEQDELGLAPRP